MWLYNLLNIYQHQPLYYPTNALTCIKCMVIKNIKNIKTAPPCFGSRRNHPQEANVCSLRMVPAWTETWLSSFYIFNVFNNHTFYTSECISWIIQWLIILMQGVIMKIYQRFGGICHLHLEDRRDTCRWKKNIPLKYWCLAIKLHNSTSQKKAAFVGYTCLTCVITLAEFQIWSSCIVMWKSLNAYMILKLGWILEIWRQHTLNKKCCTSLAMMWYKLRNSC